MKPIEALDLLAVRLEQRYHPHLAVLREAVDLLDRFEQHTLSLCAEWREEREAHAKVVAELERSSTEARRAARCGAEEVARAVALLRVAEATATSTIGPTFALGTRQAYGAAADLLLRGLCDRAPQGWVCSREPDHDGPCAAHEIPPGSLSERGGS